MTEYNVAKATKAQFEYQDRTKSPRFAPTTGECWSCGRNIYEPHFWKKKPLYIGHKIVETTEEDYDTMTGVTVKEAEETLVTGCPHCHRSYCD